MWRISNYADLSGRGGGVAARRWNHKGSPIVYCSDHPSTAMLEILVNVDAEDLPEAYQLLEIDIPDTVVPVSPNLPDNWRDDRKITRDLFDTFCADAKSPVMTVPSVVMPHAFNHLINPRHPAAEAISIRGATMHPLDPRFLA
ncbi:MAG: RES family NAD+ phosphorylase [Oricola sp.]